MPDRVILQMCFRTPLRNERRLRQVLDVFHDFPAFAPRHWSPRDERSLPPFDDEEAVRAFLADKFKTAQAVFKRNKTLRYEGFVFARDGHLETLRLKFGDVTPGRTYQALYEFGAALARSIEPEFGFVHPIWMLGTTASQDYSAAGIIKASEIEKYGPRSLCARTWLGPRLADALGKDIAKCGLVPTSVAKNLIQVDLVESPWDADFATLSTRLQEVMAVLTKTDWFGDYAESKYQKGKKWVPLGQTRGGK